MSGEPGSFSLGSDGVVSGLASPFWAGGYLQPLPSLAFPEGMLRARQENAPHPPAGGHAQPPGSTFSLPQRLHACTDPFCRIHIGRKMIDPEEECCAFGYIFWNQRERVREREF